MFTVQVEGDGYLPDRIAASYFPTFRIDYNLK
jgi:hypothetical protein